MRSLWSAFSNLLTIQFAGFIVREIYCEVDDELGLHTFAKTLLLSLLDTVEILNEHLKQ